MNKVELNPFTGEKLNPETRVVKNGKVTQVVYFEDYFKKTGVYDHHVGHGVVRLNQKLTPTEWKEVRKYFKNYNQKWFKWGTAKPDMVVKTLYKMRNPEVERVVVRHKMTAKAVVELKEMGANVKDCVTGEWLIPKDDN